MALVSHTFQEPDLRAPTPLESRCTPHTPTATRTCPTAARAQRPEAARDLARPVAQLRRRPPVRDASAPSCAAPSTSASPTSTWPTTTARRPARPRRLRPHLPPGPRALPRRADLSTKAGYLMWPGPYGEWGSRKYLLLPRPEPARAWASTTSTSSTRTGPTPTRRWRRRWARCTPPSQQGKALYAGISNYSAEQTREAAAILGELGTPLLIHQPATRCSTAAPRTACWTRSRARCGLHRLLAAGAGPALRPLPRRHPRGLARGERHLPHSDADHRGDGRHAARTERHGRESRPVPGADGAGLGAARRPVTSALVGASSPEQSRTASPPRSGLDFADDELARIDAIVTR